MIRQEDLPLMVDLYELAMAQAYWVEQMTDTAVFSLFFRELPENRHFVLACGQQHIAERIGNLRFTDEHIERLRQLDRFRPDFLDWLRTFAFSGSIRAVDEGTPVFPQEPILEVTAPIAEAQIFESLIMNYVHLESVLASKAVRFSLAAGDRPVVDFGMRRMHGLDAAHRGVRAYRLAGLSGTSNVRAGLDFGLEVSGTMAHSFVQAYPDEMDAFRVYARLYPGTTLLVDTYDSRRAVRRIVEWLQQEPDVRIGGIRLDSGDLDQEARDCREILDDAGFTEVKIMVSGGLDEYRIADLRQSGSPIDGFGVGTAIGAAKDAPALELAYKLTEYAGEPKMKTSSGKKSWPGPKQVFRQFDDHGLAEKDIIAGEHEQCEGTPLLKTVMADGKAVPGFPAPLDDLVYQASQSVAALPPRLRELGPAQSYPVEFTDYLQDLQAKTLEKVAIPPD